MLLQISRADTEHACTAQGFERKAIFNRHSTGSDRLSLELVTLHCGEESAPHAHVGSETVVYTLEGSVRLYYGPTLEQSTRVGPGDSVFIPAGLVHYVVNEDQIPMIAIVARSPDCREVIEFPHLRPVKDSFNYQMESAL